MSSKVPYNDSFEGDAQVSLEERISSRISELTEGTIADEVCNEIGKEALYTVIAELRPDLLEGRLTRRGDTNQRKMREILTTLSNVEGMVSVSQGVATLPDGAQLKLDTEQTDCAFTLKEVEGDKKIGGTVRCGKILEIFIQGYGVSSMENGFGAPVVIEFDKGTPKVYVWSNINSEDPVTIDLKDASERNRRD